MNAHALLTSQGWRGYGHTLHPSDNSIGLSQRLLVSKKENVLGIGKKQHHTSDQWWMNAFDKSLKGLDVKEEGKAVEAATCGGLELVSKGGMRWKWLGQGGGLYGSFVKGVGLGGTIGVEEKQAATGKQQKRKRRRESGPVDGHVKNMKKDAISTSGEDKRQKKATKMALREGRNHNHTHDDSDSAIDALNVMAPRREEGPMKKVSMRNLQERGIAIITPPDSDVTGEHGSARRSNKEDRVKRKARKKASIEQEHSTLKTIGKTGTKEERRERRRQRRVQRAASKQQVGDEANEPKKKRRK